MLARCEIQLICRLLSFLLWDFLRFALPPGLFRKFRHDLRCEPGRKGRITLFQPVQGLDQVLPSHTFEQVAGRAAFDRFEQILILTGGGQDDDFCIWLFRLDQTGGGDPVAVWHSQIHQDQVRVE